MVTDANGQENVLDRLETEASSDASESLESLAVGELVLRMSERDERATRAVRAASPQIAGAIEAVVERMESGGRLIYVGAGTSGRLGVLDASEVPPTFGLDPSRVVGVIAGGRQALTTSAESAEDDPAAGAKDVRALSVCEADVVVGIASSGRTPYVLGAVEAARAVGAFTVGLSCNTATPLSTAADQPIELSVGREFIAGSTRLVAGTATKMVLNMISTIAMVKLGHTYGPYMIDVRATNEKLRRRAVRIVAAITGATYERSRVALEEADWNLRAAAVIVGRGLSVEDAIDALQHVGGSLRKALAVR